MVLNEVVTTTAVHHQSRATRCFICYLATESLGELCGGELLHSTVLSCHQVDRVHHQICLKTEERLRTMFTKPLPCFCSRKRESIGSMFVYLWSNQWIAGCWLLLSQWKCTTDACSCATISTLGDIAARMQDHSLLLWPRCCNCIISAPDYHERKYFWGDDAAEVEVTHETQHFPSWRPLFVTL